MTIFFENIFFKNAFVVITDGTWYIQEKPGFLVSIGA